MARGTRHSGGLGSLGRVSDMGLIRYTTQVAVQNKPILDSNYLALRSVVVGFFGKHV